MRLFRECSMDEQFCAPRFEAPDAVVTDPLKLRSQWLTAVRGSQIAYFNMQNADGPGSGRGDPFHPSWGWASSGGHGRIWAVKSERNSTPISKGQGAASPPPASTVVTEEDGGLGPETQDLRVQCPTSYRGPSCLF